MENCLFCKIAAGEIPAKKAYEDEKILCFYDIAPQAPVHLLVIPKVHIASANEVTEENSSVVAHIFATLPKIAREVGLDDGYRIVSNCGSDACQSVQHLHFHILGGAKLSENMA
jgi:histidine triad (HIT) family protein